MIVDVWLSSSVYLNLGLNLFQILFLAACFSIWGSENCASWCANHEKGWGTVCRFDKCSSCDECTNVDTCNILFLFSFQIESALCYLKFFANRDAHVKSALRLDFGRFHQINSYNFCSMDHNSTCPAFPCFRRNPRMFHTCCLDF